MRRALIHRPDHLGPTVVIVAALACLAGGLAASGQSGASSASDREAIRTAALDYAFGWYAGDAARMRSALHPDLAKRIVVVDAETGKATVEHMDRDQLIGATGKGYGSRTAPDDRRAEVSVLDVHGNAASVKLEMSDRVDYLHLGRFDGRWLVVNVLWEWRAGASAAG